MFSLNYPSGLVMKYEMKPNGLKFRGWENLEKGIQSLGVSYSMLHAVLSTRSVPIFHI